MIDNDNGAALLLLLLVLVVGDAAADVDLLARSARARFIVTLSFRTDSYIEAL